MAERRIMRRNQAMQSKKRENPPVILEEDEQNQRSEKTVVSKPKNATVEVTVKVKKRRDKTGDSTLKVIPLNEREYPKGSWGDLLVSSSRSSLNRKESDLKQKKETSKEPRKINFKTEENKKKYNNHEHSPLCQRIPLTDDLYLETHTHFKKPHPTDRSDEDRILLKQNEELRREVLRLKKEVEVSKVRSGPSPRFSPVKMKQVTSDVCDGHRGKSTNARLSGPTQGTQTSTTSLISPRKGSKVETETVIKSPGSKTAVERKTTETSIPVELIQLETMRLQNEELRQQISKLFIDINQTRSQNCEFVNTIKELHQTADALTRANRELQEKHNLLILNHHGQQALQDQLLQIVSHNVQMKETLETLMNKQGSPTAVIDDAQLAQFRNVIKDVKSTIAQEMQGLARLSASPSSAFLVEKDVSDSAFNIKDSSLNDTNASEIRRILATESPETHRGRNAQEERSSSTQYLNLYGFTGSGVDSSHFRPSPLTVSKFSPRISTPNSFSNFSMSLSEVNASSLQHPAGHGDDKWKALEDEVSRTFIPLRNELSNCSTSSYSGSSSSSPNPMMMKQ